MVFKGFTYLIFAKKENRAQINIKLRDCNFSKYLYKDSTYLNNGAHMFSVIQMNSDFIEFSDVNYHNYGFNNMVIIYGSLIGVSFVIPMLDYEFFTSLYMFLSTLYVLFLAFIIIFSGIIIHYSQDNTGYTHYPIRINRKTKKSLLYGF